MTRGLIDERAYATNKNRELGVVTVASRRTAYYVSFMDLVRRQLSRDYDDEELAERGLKIYTTLDPSIQATAEEALVAELERLQGNRAELEGAVVVTSPHNAEVRALVGGKRIGFDGFNRALDAQRQIGSLIKPAVYLAALESGSHSLATQLDDEPITVELDNGQTWSPQNFDEETHGQVTAVRALAESLNLATVHLGLEIGVGRVARVLERLGVERETELYPSLLLGAIELTPYEVTQLYNTIANGGFRVPLKAVRAVVDGEGNTLQRYVARDRASRRPVAVFALNQGLVQVMERGTGATAKRLLPANLTTAGKTGTSDGFATVGSPGFSNDILVVTWVGNDGNASVGLTGGTGAAQIWARVMRSVEATSYDPPPPEGAELVWIDYNTGLATDQRCPDAVHIAIPSRASAAESRGLRQHCRRAWARGFASGSRIGWTDRRGRLLAGTLIAHLDQTGIRRLSGLIQGVAQMNFILWLIVGGLLGWVASMIMGTNDSQGKILNIVVGIIGAFLGGLLLSGLFDTGTINQGDFSVSSLLVSLIGAVILLAIVNLFRRKRRVVP